MIISNATHREEDLIPRFLDHLESVLPPHPDTTREIVENIRKDTQKEDYFGTEDSMYDLQDLFTMMDDVAPEGTYFGSHEGDGACFGFWPTEDEDAADAWEADEQRRMDRLTE